jgi:hypothetical protein
MKILKSDSTNERDPRQAYHDDDESFICIEEWDENKSSVNRCPNLDKEYAELRERFRCCFCSDTFKSIDGPVGSWRCSVAGT